MQQIGQMIMLRISIDRIHWKLRYKQSVHRTVNKEQLSFEADRGYVLTYANNDQPWCLILSWMLHLGLPETTERSYPSTPVVRTQNSALSSKSHTTLRF